MGGPTTRSDPHRHCRKLGTHRSKRILVRQRTKSVPCADLWATWRPSARRSFLRRRLAWLISSFFATPAAARVLQWVTSLRASVRFFRRQRVLRPEANRRKSVRFSIMRCNLLDSWLLRMLNPSAAGESSEQFTIRNRRRHKFEKLNHPVNSLVGRLLKHFWNNISPLGTPVAF